MFKSITKRDLKFFIFGILFIMIFDLVLNWPEAKQAYFDGFNATSSR
jgi:hypothetical protein